MAEDKERISQSPSYVLVNRQLQDLVRTQNTAIVKLQCMVGNGKDKICNFLTGQTLDLDNLFE